MAKKEKVSEQIKPVTIESAKLIQGMSLVLSGAVKMLEAIEPHVKIDGGFVLNLLTGNIPALDEMGKQLMAEEKEEETATEENAEEIAAVDKPDETQAEQKEVNTAETVDKRETVETAEPKEPETAPTVTLDDITRIIVRKIKQSKGNNEKIGQILKTYGVSKVSGLKPEQYEAFITDLAAV